MMLPPGTLSPVTYACTRRHGSALRGRGARAGALIALILLLPGQALAQLLSVALDASAAAGAGAGGPPSAASLTFGVASLRAGDVDLDTWARVGLAAAGGDRAGEGRRAAAALGVGTAWRRTMTFGPLGNVIVEGGAALGLAPDAAGPALRTALGVRGTVAAVAISLALEAGNAAPAAIEPGRPPPPDPRGQAALREIDALRSRFALAPSAWDAGARLGLTYRIDRDVTLAVDASVRSLDAEPYLAVVAALRRARIEADVDGSLAVQLEAFGGATGFALGAGAFHAPRRGPASLARLWFGAGPEGVRPGVEATWTQRAGAGELRLQVDWRPWLGAAAWRAEAGLEQPSSFGTLRWTLAARGAVSGPVVQVGAVLTRPLAR
jgi:hypothetical protein